MRDCLISVIIPVYNVAPYLERSINSVLAQTHANLEVILIDDGSTDESGKICDKFAESDGRIKVIHQQNQGLSVARNVGLNEANGEWIAFLDSDDWIEKEMYATLLQLSLEYDADITSCKTKKVYFSGGEEETNDTGEVSVLDLDGMIMGLDSQEIVRYEVWNKLWRKKAIANVRFIEKQISEDIHFDRIAFLNANKFVFVDKALHNYLVMRPGSTGTSYKSKRILIFEEFDKWAEDLLSLNKPLLAEEICYIAADTAVGMYETAVEAKQDKQTLKELYKIFRKFYKRSKKSKRRTFSTKLRLRLFRFSPKLFMRIRGIKKNY